MVLLPPNKASKKDLILFKPSDFLKRKYAVTSIYVLLIRASILCLVKEWFRTPKLRLLFP